MSANHDYTFSKRWSARLVADGYTDIPNALIRNQGKLGITSTEMVVIQCLASHQWDHRLPFPATSTLATYTGKSNGTIKSSLRSLESKGYLKRVYREGQTSLYDLRPLDKVLKSYTQPIKKQIPPIRKSHTQPYQKSDTKEYSYKNTQRKRRSGYSGKPTVIGEIIRTRGSHRK